MPRARPRQSASATRRSDMDRIAPTPRNRVLGLLADALAEMEEKAKTVRQPNPLMMVPSLLGGQTPQTAIMNLLGIPALQKTVERMSYGEPLTTGSGMTTKLRPETTEAAMLAAGVAGPAAKATERAAMAAGRAGERIAERVVPQVMERGGLPAEMMQAMGQGTTSPLTVYHGTPYKFERFDPTKIGSGEGAQAYGYGHYVAESPGVAKQYAENVKDIGSVQQINDELSRLSKIMNADEIAGGYRKYRSDAGRKAAEQYDQLMMQREQVRTAPGSLYTIDLPDSAIAQMLDWDKPLSQQKQVKAALDRIGKEIALPKMQDAEGAGFAYQHLANAVGGPQNAAALLRNEGISGIKYLDAQSRPAIDVTTTKLLRLQERYDGNAEKAVDEFMRSVHNTPKEKAKIREELLYKLQKAKSQNFVVFPGNEDLLKIMERNGVPMTSLLD